MEPYIGLFIAAIFAYCLRWNWDVPRGTFAEANFSKKKEQYEKDVTKEARVDTEGEIAEIIASSVPYEGKMRISAKMVETVKIGDKWYDVVDANYFEIIN